MPSKKPIAWNRKVNLPRLTKRVKKPTRVAFTMERRMITAAALIRTLKADDLSTDNLYRIFGVLHYVDMPVNKTNLKKALPLMRKMIKENELEDWTR